MAEESAQPDSAENGTVEVDRSAVSTLFDLRTVIAILFGTFGIILLIVAFTDTTQTELDKAGGIRINLWTGIAMLVASALFVAWVRLKPPLVATADDDDEPAHGPGS
ncbi:MAG: hypothetical protein M3Y71_17225 [Actinomycetota bacterium]|nr:hypothetical protein [Actinomycetota bacterium]